MAGEEPLLTSRPSSDHSSERIDEEDSLLTGQRTSRPAERRGWGKWREIGLFVWALLASAAVIVLAVAYQHHQSVPSANQSAWGPDGKPTGKRNLIFMVSDGMGPTSLSMTRSFRQYESGLPIDDILVLDQHHVGTSRTRSSNSLVTDSAAGATAFSCGFKSYNGAISVLPDHSPCGTVLEAAKAAGYMTGLVVTTRITDATPACFAAHVNYRGYEDQIAEQEVGNYALGRQVDVMLGGGRCHFLANSTEGSCRADGKDVVGMAKEKGFSYIDSRSAFDGLNGGSSVQLPLLGLFADGDIPYEIDRRFQDDTYPSLEEMARTALRALSDATKDSEQGFFIMIEGSRIDHAGHANDPAAQVHEVLAYDRAFSAVLEFLENDDTPGVVVSTSDHETGGLAAARQLHTTYPEYLWYPSVLANASHSVEYLNNALGSYLSGDGKYADRAARRVYVRRHYLEEGQGIYDATDAEVDSLIEATAAWPSNYAFADMISRRAQIGWSTHGHSAVDVNIYASSSKDAFPLVGNHENTEVGDFLAQYLDVDVPSITRQLREAASASSAEDSLAWMGDPFGPDFRFDKLDSYHGDFKKRDLAEDESLLSERSCGCGSFH